MHDPGAAEPDRAGDVAGLQSPAQQPGRRSTAPERGRVSLQQLGGLAQVLAHEPLQILDGALLAAGGAVLAVQE